MEKLELVKYEAPTISEYISNDFLQELMAKYISWKVNRKLKRLNKRIKREQYFSNLH